MLALLYIPAILLGYLLGSSNMALYLSALKRIDLRGSGSGNLGASNALITMGWKAAVIVGIHDIGKAALAVILARRFFPTLEFAGAAAGIACVLGHIFPFYLRFKGGKGFASYLGMTLALNWKFALMVFVLVAIVTLVTDYIVIGTVTTVIVVPTYLSVSQGSWILAAILCVGTAAILYKHRENYYRLRNGTEIGLRRANKGADRRV